MHVPTNAPARAQRISWRLFESGLWLRLGIAAAGLPVLAVAMIIEGTGHPAAALALFASGATGAFAAIRRARRLLDEADAPTPRRAVRPSIGRAPT
jgi:hypothetical protein